MKKMPTENKKGFTLFDCHRNCPNPLLHPTGRNNRSAKDGGGNFNHSGCGKVVLPHQQGLAWLGSNSSERSFPCPILSQDKSLG